MNIGQRVVEIVIKGHDASVAAFKSLQANATESKKKLADLANEVPGLSRAISLVTNPLVAAAAAVAALGVAMVRAYNASVQLGAGFMDMSNRTEMSVESLARWKYIAEQNGASINDFEAAFRKLRQTMADAANKDDAAVKIFRTLGVEAIDTNGKMRDLETVMLEIGQSVRQYGVASRQGAAAQDALGRGSSALVAIIKQTTDALGAQSSEAKALSSNMTTAWAESADAADDAAQRFKFAFDNLKAAAVPAQTWIAEAATALVAGLSRTLDEYLAAEHNKFVQERKASGLAAGEAATAAMYQGIQQGFDKAPSADNSKALADAIIGDEKALVAQIAERIKAAKEAAIQQALVGMASAMAPEATIQAPIKFDFYAQAENVKKETDALLAEAMGVDIDGALNVPVVITLDEEATANALEEMQVFEDATRSMRYGIEQLGSSAIQAFAAGEAGAMKFGTMLRTMVIQAIADAIAKMIVMRTISAFTGGISDMFGGLKDGGQVPRRALGGSIPHAAAGYSVPDGPRGMDSRLIAAMPGEEVINRQLSQRLDRFISSMEFGAAVSPFAMSGAGGGRGNVIVNFEVGRPVGVLDALSYGEVAATAARKVAEANL